MKKAVDDKIVKAKGRLSSFSEQQKTSPRQAILALKPEINKLRRGGVSVSKIVDLLKEEDIIVSISLLRQVAGPLRQKKVKNAGEQKVKQEEKSTVQQSPLNAQQEKPLNTTKKTELPPVVVQKTMTPKPAVQTEEKKPGFKVPDLSTLPPELTNIPGFDHTSPEAAFFVNAEGKKMVYLKGRIIADPDQSTGPVHGFSLEKHKSPNGI